MNAKVAMFSCSRSAILLRMSARSVGVVERPVDILVGRAGHFAEWLTGDRRGIHEVLTSRRGYVLSADPIVVASPNRDRRLELSGNKGERRDRRAFLNGTHGIRLLSIV